MPYDAFTRFPRRFSSRPSLAKNIYRSLRNAMGPAFDQDGDSRVQAKLYARAMGMAHAMRTLERVKKNQIALSATDLLTNLEGIYGVIPGTNSTFRERRLALHARMLLSRGSRPEAVQSIMIALLGADFEEWLFATADTLIRYPDTTAEAKLVGNYVPAGSSARVLRAQAGFFSGTQTVAVEELTGSDGETTGLVGRKILVDPASKSRRETVTIEDVTTDADGRVTSITSTFAGVHDTGTLLTTQHFPTWTSNAHQHAFRLSEAAATDDSLRRRANAELRRVMKGVATWGLTRPGPIYPDTSLVGVTEIGEATSDPVAEIQEILGDNIVAYWGALSDFKQDTSGNDNHLTLVGSEPAATDVDGTMGGITLTDSTELACDAIASIASGTDQAFTVVFWGQWVSGGLAVWAFEKNADVAKHNWSMPTSMTGSLFGVQRIDDSSNTVADNTGVDATGVERFFCHAFAAGGSALNVLQVDATVQNPALNVNPTTFDRFRLGGLNAGTFKVARMVVLSVAITEAQAAALRAHWIEKSSWDA